MVTSFENNSNVFRTGLVIELKKLLICRDTSPWETRGTQLMETRGTCYQPDHHRPDSPKDMHGTVILSGPPQGKANDVSSSPIQGRANDAGRA